MNYTYYRRYRPSPRRTSFRSFFWLVVTLVVLLLILRGCISVISSFWKDKLDQATVSLNQGSAELTEWGQTDSHDVADAELFLVGDTVKTADDGMVTLTFTNGTIVVLDQNSSLNFSHAEVTEDTTILEVELMEGRAFVKQSPKDAAGTTLQLHTDVMNTESISATYLVSNQAGKEYIYGFDGQTTVDFVDRSQDDSVIETVTIEKGKKSVLSDEDERNLLARQSLTLIADAGDDLIGDSFVAYNQGHTSALGPSEEISENTADATSEEDSTDEIGTDETTTETTTESTPLSSLQIKVTSPGLNSTIQKSAIAIEGSIVAGTANTVTVTWDGNNQPYTLGGFAPGDVTFRYVADASYGNFKAGVNTFTVVATAADGTVSNTVTVVITGEF